MTKEKIKRKNNATSHLKDSILKRLKQMNEKRYNFILIIIFIILISMPLILNILNIEVTSSDEKRILAKRPNLNISMKDIRHLPGLYKELKDYKNNYESYFNENFGFRNIMVRYNNYIKLNTMGISGNSKVIIGDDGWFFLGEYGDNLNYLMNYNPLTQEELKHAAKILQERHDMLASKGIKYLLVISPDKASIYPEYLPKKYQQAKNRSELDKLVNFLNTNTNITIVDLRTALLKQKKNESIRLYEKTDTHWNAYGAFISYQAIMTAILENSPNFSDIKALDLLGYNITTVDGKGGDLAVMLSSSDFIDVNRISMIPKDEQKATHIEYEYYSIYGSSSMGTINDSSLPKAIFFKDSFMNVMIPYLSEHFEESIYIWDYKFDEDLIAKEKPDIVVTEFVERNLRLAIISQDK